MVGSRPGDPSPPNVICIFAMSLTDNAKTERVRPPTVVPEDVWFLSGPTQPGKAVVHTPIDRNPYVVGRKTGV